MCWRGSKYKRVSAKSNELQGKTFMHYVSRFFYDYITSYMIILWCMWLIRLFLYNRCDLAIFKIEAMPLLFRFQTRAFKHLRMTPDSLGAKKSKHQLPPPNTTGGSSHDGFLIMVINPQVPRDLGCLWGPPTPKLGPLNLSLLQVINGGWSNAY